MANSESLARNSVTVDYAILHRPATLVAIALLLFLLQLILAVSILDIVAPYNLRGMWITIPDFPDRLNDTGSMLERVFSRLNGWDGHWYHHIASNGYQCSAIPESNNPYQCNVAFFPLLSMLGAGLGSLGIDLLYALPLVSQLAWFATILAILWFARSITTLHPLHLLVLLLLVAYPGALYGFVAYSESLLTLLVVLITILAHHYLANPRWPLLAGLVLCCFMLGLVKGTGLVAAAIPVLMALLHPRFDGKWFAREQLLVYAASSASLAGLLAFFLYSEIRFGDWALYFRYVGSAWGSDGTLRLNPLHLVTNFSWHDILAVRLSNVIAVTMPLAIGVVAAVSLRFAVQTRYLSLAILGTVLMLFYVYTVPGNNGQFTNFNLMRHMLPLVALLVLLAMTLPLSKLKQQTAGIIALVLLGLVYLQFHFQMEMFHAFKFGYWVS